MIFGVAIGVAMMVSIDLANSSAQRAFELSTDAVAGRTTHRIIAGGPPALAENVYFQLRQELGYSLSAPIVEAYVLAEALGGKPMRLVGIDPFAEPPFRSYFNSTEGDSLVDVIPFVTQPGAVIISDNLAQIYDVSLDDEFILDYGGKKLPVHLVGLLRTDDDVTKRALTGIIFTDISSAQEMLDMPGQLSHIDLIVEDSADLDRIKDILPAGATLETAAAQQNAIRQMTAAFELNLSALSLLALVVGMFLIYNTVTFTVLQRRPMFGILRCIGVTGRQLFWLIIAEAILVSAVGSILGVGLGILLGRGTVGLITQTINDFYFVVNVQDIELLPLTLAKGILVGVGAAVFSSAVPALEAARTTPQTTLQRSSLESRVNRVLPWLWLAWAGLTLAGVWLLSIRAGLVVMFAGLFAVLIGAALLTPPLTAALMRLVTPITHRLLGVLGRLAPRDIVRSLSRTSIAIAALMTAVSVVVGVSIMIGSFRSTVVQWLDLTLQADIYISPPTITANRVTGKLPPEIVAEIRNWPGIETIVTSTGSDVYVPDFERQIHMVAVDGDVSRGNRPYAWIRDEGRDPWQQLAAGEGIIISEALAQKENLETPIPPIIVETNEGPVSFPVLAVFYDYSSDQGTIIIDHDFYAELWGDMSVSSMGLFISQEQTVDEIASALQSHFSGRQELLIQSNQSLRQGSLEIFDRTFAITAALRLLAVIVAFIGVLSALMSLQLERARELGVLRANGMTIHQMWSLTLIETGLMGGTAGLLAMPVGFVLAWILIYVINVRSFGWTLQMQIEPANFIQAFVVSIAAALLAGIYPSFRLGKLVIANAIREE
ncbi:MAG: ABC transporter permease [Candidatus Promineifilaceae bacterium]|nr:ABC transporter permease [Candidatus Promineifilaceae bacterium]